MRYRSSMSDYTYIHNDSMAHEALRQLSGMKRVGVDSETTGLQPVNKAERLRLVQIADGPDHAYIFDVWRLGFEGLIALADYLDSPVLKLGHNLKFDAKWFKHSLGCKRLPNLVDTMLAAQVAQRGLNLDFVGFGLEDVVARELDRSVDKRLQTSNWAADGLSHDQLQYAAEDATIVLEVWPKLS